MKNVLSVFIFILIFPVGIVFNSRADSPADHVNDDIEKTEIEAKRNIIVKTAQDLINIASETHKGSSGEYDGFRGYTIELAADIDLKNHEWIPIGTSESPFRGSFDGSGYKIYNIRTGSEETGSEKQFIGFFGYIKGESMDHEIKIENITLEGGMICGGENTEYAGAVAGCVQAYGYDSAPHITISNCHSSVKVIGGSGFLSFTGGIIGEGEGKGEVSGTLTIENCTNSGTITGIKAYYSYTGGIIGSGIGCGEGSGKGDGSLTIKNCINNGAVFGAGASSSSTGGIIGYGSATGEGEGSISIMNCINSGEISSVEASSSTGGIVGYGHGYGDGIYGRGTFVVLDCSNKGIITGGTASSSLAGGVIGRAYSEGFAEGKSLVRIQNCINNGEVKKQGLTNSYIDRIMGQGYTEGNGILEVLN